MNDSQFQCMLTVHYLHSGNRVLDYDTPILPFSKAINNAITSLYHILSFEFNDVILI